MLSVASALLSRLAPVEAISRRDAFVLAPLPVPLPVQMLGRLLGLGSFCVLFILLLNGIPAIAFPAVTAHSACESVARWGNGR